MPQTRSMVATASAAVGGLAALLTVLGAAGAAAGWLEPLPGFRLFSLGAAPLGLLTLVLGVIGLARTRAASGRAGRRHAGFATAVGLALVAVVLIASAPGWGLPAINDITTDLDDPPGFVAAARELGDPLAHPGQAFAVAQRGAYPDLAPLELPLPPPRAFARVREATERIGLEIVDADPAAGRLEARQTSRIFRFVDDVVVRVRPSPGGSIVDVRSRSRDGRGDLGVNARRIRALREALR